MIDVQSVIDHVSCSIGWSDNSDSGVWNTEASRFQEARGTGTEQETSEELVAEGNSQGMGSESSSEESENSSDESEEDSSEESEEESSEESEPDVEDGPGLTLGVNEDDDVEEHGGD